MHNLVSLLENETHKPLCDFDTNRSLYLQQTTWTYNNQQKEKNMQNCGFAVPAGHRVKLKGIEKKNKYIDLTRELKKLWNMKVTIILIIIGAFTVTKWLIQGLEDLVITERAETTQTTALWRVLVT